MAGAAPMAATISSPTPSWIGELTQLSAMARVLPPIFMVVTAFLINMILTRLIALEREQIGLLKALGYWPLTIALHYVKLVMVIAVIGVAIGFGLGTWLGDLLTRLYGTSFTSRSWCSSAASTSM